MAHMDMGGGDDMVMKIMLRLGHFFLEIGLMVVKKRLMTPITCLSACHFVLIKAFRIRSRIASERLSY
jgi:hypothetical protein